MSPWFRALLLGVVLSALGKSESVSEDNVDGLQTIEGSAGWDSTDCQPLQDRLETLESAVRSIVSAMASQKNEIFAPITAILEQNAALRVILSSSPVSQGDPENSTIHPDFSYSSTPNPNSEADHTEKLTAVNQLKGAVKCSLAQILDIKVSEKEPNPSGSINASLSKNKSIEIEWSPLSPECIAYNSGVWIRVFESDTPSSGEPYLSIPRKCLTEKSNSTFSFALHSATTSDDSSKESDCHFELKNVLIECRSYKVEVVPNYESLKGRPLTAEIVTPSTNGNSIDMKSLLSVATSSTSLTLNWKDNSGCAPQLTSFNLKTIPDGKANATDVTLGSLKIPRTCLKLQRDENQHFSLTLSADHECPVKWTSLDACRKYAFEMKSEYSKTWSSAPHFWETFTSQRGSSPTDSIYGFSNCMNSEKFYCTNIFYRNHHYSRSRGFTQPGCLNINQICDGFEDCATGVDEQYCDDYCITGFKCGRQCISKELVCNGRYDCIDGSDEHYNCEYAKSCSELKDSHGSFSSLTIDSDNAFKNASQKTIVAISVQSNHIIWLSFSKFNTKENHLVKVYDGPYSTSPLLLSHSGSTKPSSVRSSSNNLYVEFPSYYDKSYGVSASYTSMESMGKPFVPGCGGYIYGNGSVSSPNYLSNHDNDLDECFWFVEAGQLDGVIFAKRNHVPPMFELHTTTFFSRPPTDIPIMTVYDGWNSTGQVLYDELDSSKPAQVKSVIYSVSQKMMIRFTRPKVSCSSRVWSVTTIPTVSTTTSLAGMIGTIKSPNYPAAYPDSSDYRWKIFTEPGTSVRLLFALFETQDKFDYVFVYDGPTVNSPLLLEKSGLSSTPFSVNSSSNEMLVRFTSDENITLPGFLAVYSTV